MTTSKRGRADLQRSVQPDRINPMNFWKIIGGRQQQHQQLLRGGGLSPQQTCVRAEVWNGQKSFRPNRAGSRCPGPGPGPARSRSGPGENRGRAAVFAPAAASPAPAAWTARLNPLARLRGSAPGRTPGPGGANRTVPGIRESGSQRFERCGRGSRARQDRTPIRRTPAPANRPAAWRISGPNSAPNCSGSTRFNLMETNAQCPRSSTNR